MRHAIAVAMTVMMSVVSPRWALAADKQETLGLIADGPYRTALAMRIARGIDHRGGLRILPVIGKSPAQNLADLMELRGIDLAIVPSDSMAFIGLQGLMPDLGGKIDYLVKLANVDVHVLGGPAIRSLPDLKGKRVAIGSAAHASYETSLTLLDSLKLDVTVLPLNGSDAIAAVKAGTADAAILVGVSPLPEIGKLTQADGLHLVAIPPEPGTGGFYSPSLLTDKLYPGLLNGSGPVETVSSSLVIAAVRWPKGSPQQQRLARFTGVLFASLLEDSAGAGINLNAEVPGWTRSQASEQALQTLAKGAVTPSSSAQEN